jgi:hypothetical protein
VRCTLIECILFLPTNINGALHLNILLNYGFYKYQSALHLYKNCLIPVSAFLVQSTIIIVEICPGGICEVQRTGIFNIVHCRLQKMNTSTVNGLPYSNEKYLSANSDVIPRCLPQGFFH